MKYRVLGSIEVVSASGSVAIASRRQQAVLLTLLMNANHVVSMDRLVDALWNEDPPTTAKSQVQFCISALRRMFSAAGEPEAITTRLPGYLLQVDDGALDAHEFEVLATKGRAAARLGRKQEAVAHLRAALVLWRGPVADGMGSRANESAIARLEEGRLAVIEDCMELELELGRHHEVIGELGEAVTDAPLHERLRELHVVALYRSGRQASALASLQEARSIFREELGLDLRAELLTLERRILDHDPTLHLSEPTTTEVVSLGAPLIPSQLPTPVAHFVGRADILAQIDVRLGSDDGEPSRQLPIVLLGGSSGIGKSALSVYAAHELRSRFPDGQLYAQLRGSDAGPTGPAVILEGFLSALGVATAAIPNGLDNMAGMFRSLTVDRRILMVLDDAVNAAQVTPLLPGSPSCAVLVTSRNRMPALFGAYYIDVGPFDEQASLELFTRVVGRQRLVAEMDAARSLARLCGHLPLALQIVAAKLAVRQHRSIAEIVMRLTDQSRFLDELAIEGIGVRSSISFSYAGLDESAKRLFALIGIMGSEEFSQWTCGPLMDQGFGVVGETVDQLVDAHMIDEVVGEDGIIRYRMHALMRAFAHERLAADFTVRDRDEALRRLLGCWLALAVEAHRRDYGGDFTVLHGSAEHWLPPDAPAAIDGLLKAPMVWFRSERGALAAAIDQAARAGYDELCWDLAMTSVVFFESGAFVEYWRETHRTALAAVRRAGNRRGEAAMLYSQGGLAIVQHRFDEAATLLSSAHDMFTTLGEVHGRGLAQRNLAFVDRMQGRYEAALARYEEALVDLRAVGDMVGLSHALNNVAQVHIDKGRYELAEQPLAESLAACRAAGNRRGMAQAEYRFGELYLRKGKLQPAESIFRTALLAVRDSNDETGEAYVLQALGAIQLAQGDAAAARVTLEAALTTSLSCGDRLIRGRVLLSMSDLAVHEERELEATVLLEEALDVFTTLHMVVWQARALARISRLHHAAGRHEAAAESRRHGIALGGDSDPELFDAFGQPTP